MRRLSLLLSLALFWTTSSALAQYNPSAGSNAPTVEVEIEYQDVETGENRVRTERQAIPADSPAGKNIARDSHGNTTSNTYDLAIDGAFEGQTIVLLDLVGNDFSGPQAAVAEKGFSVVRYRNGVPEPEALKEALSQANQLWLISSGQRHLNDDHVEVIREFWEAGHGLYIWGDNEPLYADANFLAQALLGVGMSGNLYGDQNIGVQTETGTGAGVISNHLLSTGLESIYEGITIATIQDPDAVLTPLIYGSANNVVAAFYDTNGRRMILDGGFTRLSFKWDAAGTPRYIKNAAAWLANYEHFGAAVTAQKLPAPAGVVE